MTNVSPDTPYLLDDERVNALIEEGARTGQLTYAQINDWLSDLSLDVEDVELLLELLERRGVQVTNQTPEQVASQVTSQVTSQDSARSPLDAPAVRMLQAEPPARVQSRVQSGVAPQEAAPETVRTGSERVPERNADLDDVLASLQEMFARDEMFLTQEAGEAGDEEDPAIEDAFRQYLNRMGRVPLLSEYEEMRLAHLAREGTPEEQASAKNKLIEANLRLVVHVAQRHAGRHTLPLLDIIQEGNIGLMRAVDHFDPERGHRLASYATWWIRQSINKAVANQARSMRLPAHLSLAITKLQRLQRELTQSKRRPPSRIELAEAAGMTISQVDEALRAAAAPLSLDSSIGGDDDLELGETVADPDTDAPGLSLSRSDLRDQLGGVLGELPDRERNILMRRFGMGEYQEDGPKALEDVAEEMHLSRDRVRQLETRALRKLRRRVHGSALAEFFADDDD